MYKNQFSSLNTTTFIKKSAFIINFSNLKTLAKQHSQNTTIRQAISESYLGVGEEEGSTRVLGIALTRHQLDADVFVRLLVIRPVLIAALFTTAQLHQHNKLMQCTQHTYNPVLCISSRYTNTSLSVCVSVFV